MAVIIQLKSIAITKWARTIVITRRGQPTYLMSQNKRIYLWHHRLAHVSNAQRVRAFKLVGDINLGLTKKYNLAEVFVDSEDLDNSGDNLQSLIKKEIDPSFAYQIKTNTDDNNLLDKLYTSYVGSKSTRVIWRNKSMMPITEKLEEVHANLWSSYDLLS